MIELNQKTILHAPALHAVPRDGWTFFVDAEAPNWVSTDARGTWLLERIGQAPSPFAQLVGEYAAHAGLDTGKAWVHVQAFVADALRHGILSLKPVERVPYEGRASCLALSRLRECWLHTNNSCNLACRHCLVASSPRGMAGLPASFWIPLIDQAAALGVERFYITGGEPFVREDLPELINRITERHELESIVLTNAILLSGPRGKGLDRLPRGRVKFQVSLDGSTPEINDPIRGAGSLEATVAGLRELTRRQFDVTLTTVVTAGNLEDVPNLARLAASCGVRTQHLMWVHRRGRVTEGGNGWSHHLLEAGAAGPDRSAIPVSRADRQQVVGWFPATERLVQAVQAATRAAAENGILLDNLASFELRANAPAGTKFDLSNAGWQSLCVYADGHVYPSAAFANHPPLDCGEVSSDRTLERIWRDSPVLSQIRTASVVRKEQAASDPLRYLTGGGDVEHSYFFSGSFLGEDPYYPLSQALLLEAMDRLTARKLEGLNRRSGYDAPRIHHAMGDGAVVCGTAELSRDDREVAFLHSNCVLAFDVEKPRRIVQQFYGQAAEKPQTELCCPTRYSPEAVSHIPQEVLDRFYGCGSPIADAKPQAGQTLVDLGSGAGIDCFIAAKRVGPTGRVIGVDMTEPMLAVARESQKKVALALGYDVVEFRQGYLEAIPVEDKTADRVTSNCVVNLSPDKPKVFAEIWRILKDHGRAVIADIVSDQEVPPRLKVNERLWGECIVGALTEEGFLALLEQAGFHGLSVLKKSFWKTIEGFNFYSVTVQGFKFEKSLGCQFIGQRALYRGPFKAALDEEGHLFPRNVAVEVCTDTAAKLSNPPYAEFFQIVEPNGTVKEPTSAAACCPAGEKGAGCC